jgi:pilus assembly protein CpaB
MDSRPLKLLAAITAIAALLLGYLAITTHRTEDANQRALPVATGDSSDWPRVVVAAVPLEEGKAVEASGVTLVAMQVAPVAGFSRAEDVIGKTPARRIGQGEPLTKDHFALVNDLARRLGTDERAVAIQVNDVVGVGGLLQAGDFVDVIAYVQADGRQVRRSQARVVMERLRILAYGSSESDKRSSGSRTAVLAVPAADLPRLVLAANAGNLRLALHGTDEGAARLGSGAALNELDAPTRRTGGGEQIIVYRGGSSGRIVQ